MKAIIWTKYGPPGVLKLKEVEKPTPKDREVLIKIYATTVTAGDCEMRSASFPAWLWFPVRLWLGFGEPKIKILGQELSGEIEATGKDVKLFKKGDKVFGTTDFGLGTYAQYKCMPEAGVIAIKPDNITYEEATTVPVGGLEALHFLKKANIQNKQKVLIIGAGGSIGTIATQLAKYYGAKVTGVDSTDKLEMIHAIGADFVIDYTEEDFLKSTQTYDVIFDIVGKSSFPSCIRLLNQNGCYLLANAGPLKMIRGKWTSISSSKKVITDPASHKIKDLIFLKELLETGKIKPVIDRLYSFEQIVEAHKYVETGHKKGNVVIIVEHN